MLCYVFQSRLAFPYTFIDNTKAQLLKYLKQRPKSVEHVTRIQGLDF